MESPNALGSRSEGPRWITFSAVERIEHVRGQIEQYESTVQKVLAKTLGEREASLNEEQSDELNKAFTERVEGYLTGTFDGSGDSLAQMVNKGGGVRLSEDLYDDLSLAAASLASIFVSSIVEKNRPNEWVDAAYAQRVAENIQDAAVRKMHRTLRN